MTMPSCRYGTGAEAVHRYVAGTATERETRDLEIHLLECARCRDAVRDAATIRAAFRTASPPVAARRTDRSRAARALGYVIPAAAAAGLIMWQLTRIDPIRSLGRIGELPGYAPLPVRAVTAPADERADSGMAAYAAGDYTRAARELSASLRDRPSPGAWFFLGISYVATENLPQAIEALNNSLDPPGNAYAAEARYYLAKAWLQRGRGDSALVHLAAVPSGHPMRSAADYLADSVRAGLRR